MHFFVLYLVILWINLNVNAIRVDFSVGDGCKDVACLDYFAQRRQLIQQEQTLSFDASVELSAAEIKVDQFLSELREQELNSFTAEHDIPSIFNFRTARSIIDNESRLLPFLWSMPKGGILHLHAMIDAQFLFLNGTYTPECYINNGTGSSRAMHGAFYYFASQPSNGEGEQWFNVNQLRQASGNVTQFDAQLFNTIQFWTPTYERDSENEMWDYFDQTLGRMISICNYLPVFNAVRMQAIEAYVQEGIQHVELRGFGQLYDLEGNLYDEINETLKLLRVWNLEHPTTPFTIRWIYAVRRMDNASSVYGDLLNAVHLRRNPRMAQFMVGFDLVDEEDRYHTLLYYLNDFLRIQKYIDENGDEPLPYFFHAGETVFDRFRQENLYDAILLNTTRIGHGFALKDFPVLMQRVIQQDIAVEVSPISNQMLELVEDMRNHPIVTMMNNGVPVTLSPDDPVIYGYVGSSYDWYMGYISWNLTLSSMKQLALNSIAYSALDMESKMRSMKHWHHLWEQWINGVLDLL